jgi:hypothetical protein
MLGRSGAGFDVAGRAGGTGGIGDIGGIGDAVRAGGTPAEAAPLATELLGDVAAVRRRKWAPQAMQKFAPAALTCAHTGQTGGAATCIGAPQA